MGREKLIIPHFLLGVLEAVSHKVNRLVLGDRVFLDTGLVGVKGQELGLVCQGVLKEDVRLMPILTTLIPVSLFLSQLNS